MAETADLLDSIEGDEGFDYMASIKATGDDYEIWACEGAIAELQYYHDNEAETDLERVSAMRTIRQLGARRTRLIAEVRM